MKYLSLCPLDISSFQDYFSMEIAESCLKILMIENMFFPLAFPQCVMRLMDRQSSHQSMLSVLPSRLYQNSSLDPKWLHRA